MVSYVLINVVQENTIVIIGYTINYTTTKFFFDSFIWKKKKKKFPFMYAEKIITTHQH